MEVSSFVDTRFASTFVQFSDDPLGELQDSHVILGRLDTGEHVIAIKPRALAFTNTTVHTYHTVVERGWQFYCNEADHIVQWKSFELRATATLKFKHSSEFWAFFRQVAEANVLLHHRSAMLAGRMRRVEEAFADLVHKGYILGWDTFHSKSIATEQGREPVDG